MRVTLPTPNRVQLDWEFGDSASRWDLACIYAVETFGLPGDKYKTELTADWMIFEFDNSKDAMIFAMRWS